MRRTAVLHRSPSVEIIRIKAIKNREIESVNFKYLYVQSVYKYVLTIVFKIKIFNAAKILIRVSISIKIDI